MAARMSVRARGCLVIVAEWVAGEELVSVEELVPDIVFSTGGGAAHRESVGWTLMLTLSYICRAAQGMTAGRRKTR